MVTAVIRESYICTSLFAQGLSLLSASLFRMVASHYDGEIVTLMTLWKNYSVSGSQLTEMSPGTRSCTIKSNISFLQHHCKHKSAPTSSIKDCHDSSGHKILKHTFVSVSLGAPRSLHTSVGCRCFRQYYSLPPCST